MTKMPLKEPTTRKIQLYLASVLIYGLGIVLFQYLPYYQKTLNNHTQDILFYLFLTYLLLAPLYYLFFTTRYSTNKPYLFLRWLINIFRKRKLRFEPEEKVALLFILVKLFYLPLMINFGYNNFNSLQNFLQAYFSGQNTLAWYPLIFTLMFTIDTVIFAFGYAFEFKFLNNVVKSVEPTLFGWIVALICYPPFNSWVGRYIPWGADDYAQFWNPAWTLIMRIIIVLLLIIYVWATIALGAKSSNLTNRGIVSRFPYSIIRHPAYVSKNLIWWLTLLPVLNWPFALGMLFWTVIYYFRAFTEEEHLSQDPEYLEYKKKVRWRFIPFIY